MKPDSFLFHIPKGSTIALYGHKSTPRECIVTISTPYYIQYKTTDMSSFDFHIATYDLHEICILSPTIGLFKFLDSSILIITKLPKEDA